MVAYWFDTTLDECLARNATRPGKQFIPPSALHACRCRLQPPTHDEGFDAIYRVRIDEKGQFLVEEVVSDE